MRYNVDMKIDVAYGRDLDDSTLQELQFLEADAYACFDSLDAEDGECIIGAIPTETIKHFKRRMSSTLVLMKRTRRKLRPSIVGIAFLSKRKKGLMHLHTVYVKPSFRKQGIGAALVKKALKAAEEAGCSIVLDVNPLNGIAMSLYKRMGFNVCKGQTIKMSWASKNQA